MNFVNSHNNIDNIDANVLEIVNTAFKTYENYSKTIESEASLSITQNEFDEFCVNNINDKFMIQLSLNDERLNDFIKIYKDLKNIYINNCEYLLGLLEKQVLVKESVNDKNSNPSFTLKNIGYSELVSLETDTRNVLVTMYSQCQEKYQQGISALFKALSKSPSS